MFRLGTVRRKLLALVALSILVTAATLPVFSWLLHRQLVQEVDDRVEAAEKAYQAELDEDLLDLELAATLLSHDTDVVRALAARDARALEGFAETFARLYPDIDVVFLAKDGTRVAHIGCSGDSAVLLDRPVVKEALSGHKAAALSARGCDRDPLPTYLIAAPAEDAGVVVVGLDFSQQSLVSAGTKLGLELAMISPEGAPVSRTLGFMPGTEKVTAGEPVLLESGDRTLIVGSFSPPQLDARTGRFRLVASMDVTGVRKAISRNLAMSMGAVLLAAVLASLFGYRVAGVMANALKRIADALKRLEQQEYVKVLGIDTGDELEDLAQGFNQMVDGLKERDKLRTTFGKYMTASVVEHLLAGKVQLGGEALTATILFSDIRSFTSISEKMDAKALVSLLNEYFTEMVAVVMQEEGVVDKYIGDAIMAVFGAPVPKEEDAVHAVRAAVGMRKALAHLNERLAARGVPPIKTGIGIHTGEVVAGNIGSEQRMEYTVIGDPVNLASRLEGVTKDVGVDILVSEDTYKLVEKHVVARPVKEVTVKGREQPVMTYEILGLAGEEPVKKA